MEDKQPINSEAHGDVIDVEEFAKAGKPVPLGRRYRIRIDKQHFTVEVAEMTGRQILALVGKTPEGFILSEKLHGGSARVIAPDEVVSFTKHGVERFMTTPRDTTEG